MIGQSGVEVSHRFSSCHQVREAFSTAGKMDGGNCNRSGSRDHTACGLPAITYIDIRSLAPAEHQRSYAAFVNSCPADVQDAPKTENSLTRACDDRSHRGRL